MTTPPAEPNLTDLLCFAIYTANLAFGRAYHVMLDDLGLTFTQWMVVMALGERETETVKSLGAKLYLESNTLTPILKKLEASGLVTRLRDRADERQVLLSLTPTARALPLRSGMAHMIDAAGLDRDDFDRARDAVTRVRDNLIAHAAATRDATE